MLTTHRASTSMYLLTFCICRYAVVRRLQINAALCCHRSETHATIADLPNSAQLGGTSYHSPKLHPGQCSSVEVRQGTVQTHTRDRHTQTRVTTIHSVS